MADPFVAEIRMFPFNFAPKGWAFCNGQLMPLAQNTALFSLLGTTYGGDGRTTFALPDLQGNFPMGQGQGQGLSQRVLGETSGSATVTLDQSQIPAHTHNLAYPGTDATLSTAVGEVGLGVTQGLQLYGTNSTLTSNYVNQGALASVGGGAAHNNVQPLLALNFCIALQGVFPPRS